MKGEREKRTSRGEEASAGLGEEAHALHVLAHALLVQEGRVYEHHVKAGPELALMVWPCYSHRHHHHRHHQQAKGDEGSTTYRVVGLVAESGWVLVVVEDELVGVRSLEPSIVLEQHQLHLLSRALLTEQFLFSPHTPTAHDTCSLERVPWMPHIPPAPGLTR